MKSKLFLIFLLLILTAPAISRNYREKYSEVLEHYSKTDIDSLKFKAALYLIDNMQKHKSPEGKGIEQYISHIMSMQPKANWGQLSRKWDLCNPQPNSTTMVPDSAVISSQYLIDNIEDAFMTWKESPWGDSVSFSQFCEFILPYRILDEHISSNWRASLREKYKGIIDNVTDVGKAFVKIRKEVARRVKSFNPFTPYMLDVISYDHIQRADCEQRCLVLASVLRAFGIPAAVDNIPCWADYSTKGHSWVSLVLDGNKTFTVNANDSIVRRHNRIDASYFLEDDNMEEFNDSPIQIKTSKGVSKIQRISYAQVYDVSDQYGVNGRICIPTDYKGEVSLCTFLTGHDWVPVAKSTTHNGYAIFENVGKNIIYLLTTEKDGRTEPVSAPILLKENNDIELLACNSNDTISITIGRKYPLCVYMPNQWKNLVNSVFEGSFDSLFLHPDTLSQIKSVPYGTTHIKVEKKNRYRFLRFRNPNKEIGLLSELYFYGKEGNILHGMSISYNVDNNTISMLHDDNEETRLKATAPDYYVGVDLGDGNEQEIEEIVFSPTSDGNGIQKEHLYKLYCYDNGWRLLDSVFTKRIGALTFHGVPRNALLLLKDTTKGHEERIFLYKDKKQIWY